MKYLNKFDTISDYQASASTLEIPNVAYITATTEVIYNGLTPTPPTPSQYVEFDDPLVESKCATLYGDGTGCTMADLGAVTAISYSDWSGTSITSFNELQYFTGLTSIDNTTFEDCSGLTSIVIPNSVTGFGYSVFEDCSSLTSVTLGNQLEQIGNDTFFNCSALSAITIPATVTRIGQNAFAGCSGLSNITFVATTLPATIGGNAFLGVSATGNITVPMGSESNFYSLAQTIGSDWTVNEQTPS